MKICSKCRKGKDASEFSSRSAAKDGLQAYCKSCAAAVFSARALFKPDDSSVRSRNWRAENPNAARESSSARRIKNPEKARQEACDWNKNNRDSINAYKKGRYITDSTYRIECMLRARLTAALKGRGSKSAATKSLLGCSVERLEARLESLFSSGMTWENQGLVWHIDHIKPCAKFDLTDPEQQKVCFHWTNLQPLFAGANLRKGDSYHTCK